MPGRVLLVFVFALGSCGEPPPPVVPFTTPDVGPRDGSLADTPIDSPDALTTFPDAPEQEVVCSIMELELGVDPISRPRHISVAPNSTGFVFGWGDAQEAREDVRVADVPEGSTMAMHKRVTDDDASARDVRVADEFGVWLDDGGSDAEYQVRGGSLVSRFETPITLSDPGANHASPRILGQEGAYWLAWLRRFEGRWSIETRRFDGDQLGTRTSTGWLASEDNLAFARAGTGFLVGWVADGDAFVGRLDALAQPVGEPRIVSTEHNARGGIDIAFDAGSAIVVFDVLVAGVRGEVRSRLLETDGTPARPEQVVSQAPLKGRSPAVVTFGGGYGVTYRAGMNDGDDHIRLAFVHGSDGVVVAEYEFGASGFDDGSPGAAVSEDGVLAIGWAHLVRDGMTSGTAIRGARLTCADAWLRCSPERR